MPQGWPVCSTVIDHHLCEIKTEETTGIQCLTYNLVTRQLDCPAVTLQPLPSTTSKISACSELSICSSLLPPFSLKRDQQHFRLPSCFVFLSWCSPPPSLNFSWLLLKRHVHREAHRHLILLYAAKLFQTGNRIGLMLSRLSRNQENQFNTCTCQCICRLFLNAK